MTKFIGPKVLAGMASAMLLSVAPVCAAPVELKSFYPAGGAQGTEFTVVAYYPTGNGDSNGNHGKMAQALEPRPIFNDSGGVIGNIGGGRYSFGFGAAAFPFKTDTGPENRYHAASFNYNPNPEPGTMILISGVIAAAGVYRRRRRKALEA